MMKKITELPEVFLSDKELSVTVSRMVKSGTVRKIGPKIYTRNTADQLEAVVARNLWPIVGLLMPGAVISHRIRKPRRARRFRFRFGALSPANQAGGHYPPASQRVRPGCRRYALHGQSVSRLATACFS